MSSTRRIPSWIGTDRRRLARWWGASCAFIAAIVIAATSLADARSDYLINALRTSPQFRVRATAAASLGQVQSDPRVITALSGALNDDNASVRAAAAQSLGRLADPSALAALRRRQGSERDPGARSAIGSAIASLSRLQGTQPRVTPIPPSGGGNARFYVVVGRPGTKVRTIPPATLDSARDFIEQTASGVPGVRVAPANGRPPGNLTGYYLDSSIVEVQNQGGTVRVRVSIVVQTHPGRNIRSMLNGSASAAGGGAALERQVIEGAFRGALRGLPQALR